MTRINDTRAHYTTHLVGSEYSVIRALLLMASQYLTLERDKWPDNPLMTHWCTPAGETALDTLEALGLVEMVEINPKCFQFTERAQQYLND